MDSTFIGYLFYWFGVWTLYAWLNHRWHRHLLTLEPAALQFCISRPGKALQVLAGVGSAVLTLGFTVLLFGLGYVREHVTVVTFGCLLFVLAQLKWTVRLQWEVEDRIRSIAKV